MGQENTECGQKVMDRFAFERSKARTQKSEQKQRYTSGVEVTSSRKTRGQKTRTLTSCDQFVLVCCFL